MRRRTLTLRLIAASAIWIVGTLCAAGLLLLLLFQDHIERRFDAALADHLQELAAASEVGQDGTLQLSWTPFDPRFNRPQSGWYWQIEQGDAVIERSQSLWPERLKSGPASADDRIQELTGPGGERLRAVVTPITLPGAPGGFVYTIAGPAVDVHQDVREFGAKLAVTLAVLALGLVGAVVAQVHYGLLPLKRMRRALAQVRSGAAPRLTESFPGEVQPLVHELNALLDHNAAILERARTQTGNLAHALKNPLTVIRSEAGAIAAPHGPVLREQVDLMGRQIEWHLARARAAGAHGVLGARAAVADVARDLQFSLQRLYRERPLEIELRDLERSGVPGRRPGPRGDARQPDGQCLQVGALPRSRSVAAEAAPSCGSRSRTTARASPNMIARGSCCAGGASTRPRPAPGSASPSCAISPSSTAARSS